MAESKKRYYWLKLQDGFFNSKRIKKLRRMSGGDTFTIIYLKMQLVAMKNDGYLYYSGLENTFAAELALDLDEKPEDVQMTINYLLSCDLMEASEDFRSYFVPYAVENTGSETASTQRSRECRAKQKMLQCNTDATLLQRQCNVEIEKEIDIEIEKDKEIPADARTQESTNHKCHDSEIVALDGMSEELANVVRDWLQYKKEKRQSYTPTGLKKAISEIRNNVTMYGEETVISCINKSMGNNWQGIVWPNKERGYGRAKPVYGNSTKGAEDNRFSDFQYD